MNTPVTPSRKIKTCHNFIKPLGVLTVCLVAAANGLAATLEWTGASDDFWSTAANWNPSGPPTDIDAARFNDQDAQFDDTVINNIVSSDMTVGALWLGQTNGVHNMQINGGVTLTVSNTATTGESLLTVGTQNYDTQTTVVSNTISGNGALVIEGSTEIDGGINQQNIDGAIVVAQKFGSGGAHWATLDMRNLANFSATASLLRIGWSDTTLRRAQGYVILAKTNNITVAGGDGEAGITVGDNRGNNNNNSGFCVLWLGQENNINANTVRFGSQKSQGRLFFTEGLVNPTFKLRDTDGVGRTEIFACGDNHQQGASGNPCTGTIDLSGGSVDLLIDTLYIARGQTSTGRETIGDLTFGAGVVDVNNLEVGYQSAPNADGTANNRVDGDLTLNGTTLRVNNLLRIGRWAGSPDGLILSRVFATDATIRANSIAGEIVNDGSTSLLSLENSTLAVTNTASGLETLSLSDSIVETIAIGSAPLIQTSELTTGGAGNTIQIGRLPGILAYPASFKLIDYEGAIGGNGFNFAMTGLPGTYTGYLSNNVANSSVDLYLTSGPIAQSIKWDGTMNGNWDTTTFNWLAGATSTNYANGDFPVFDDSATGVTTVSVATALFPGDVNFNHSSKPYTLTGAGSIAGLANLAKSGTGTLIIENNNSYFGFTTNNQGTIQIGNGGTSGSLGAGDVVNDAALVVDRSDDVTIANAISGSASGSITKVGANTVTLSGNSSFDGDVSVTTGTLAAGSGNALGSAVGDTTIASGATLDVNGQALGAESVVTSGTGIGGAGAVVNNGSGQQLNALQFLTITDDTTVGGTQRWDLRAPGGTTGDPAGAALSTGGNAYNLTKVGDNQVNIVSATIDPALADITIESGILGFEGNTTSAGNAASSLTIRSNATLRFWQCTNLFNKNIVVDDGGIIANGSGVNIVVGPMTIAGVLTVDAGGTSLNLNNEISGLGSLVKAGANTLILSGAANTYTGGTMVMGGKLVLNCVNAGSLTTDAGTTLAGTGNNSGDVSVSGSVQPGDVAVPGTLSSGSLTLETGATVTFDLGTSLTVGGGVNDLIEVNGNLNLNGNSIFLNLYQLKLTAGTYRLINYSGTLSGSFNPTIDLGGASRYGLTIDTGTPGQVNLVVTGNPNALVWSSTASTTWDIAVSSNWFNTDIAATDAFYQGDDVLFDDTPGVSLSVDIPTGVGVAPATTMVDADSNFYFINGPGKITGGGNLVKRGTSTLALNSDNDFNGTVSIEEGLLQVGSSTALGSVVGGTTVSSGATLDLGGPALAANALNLGLESVTVSGEGYVMQGAIVNNSVVNQQNAIRLVTLAGNTVFGGTARWDMRGAGATLSTSGNSYNLTKIGANQVSLVGVVVDPALGNIDVQQGIFSIETTTTSAGDPNKTISVQSGAILQFFNNSEPLNKRVALTNATINNDSGANNLMIGPVVMDGFCTIDVDGGSALTISNTLSGNASLTKIVTGTLNLVSPSFIGDTTIDAGTLALLGTANLNGSPNIAVNAGTLDVTGRNDGLLSLNSGQTLSGNGTVAGGLSTAASSTLTPGMFGVGRLSVSGAAGLGGTTSMDVDKFSFTNDVLAAGSVTYGGTLQLVNFGDPYGAGNTFKLFDADSYSGAFTTIDPASPGAGLMWDTSGLTVDGKLKVASTTPLPQPDIDSFSYSGADVTISVINGPAYGTVEVLTTTDASLPASSWDVFATSYFDMSGNFILNMAVNPGEPQRYFLIQIP